MMKVVAMDIAAPDSVASVKSVGSFLQTGGRRRAAGAAAAAWSTPGYAAPHVTSCRTLLPRTCKSPQT